MSTNNATDSSAREFILHPIFSDKNATTILFGCTEIPAVVCDQSTKTIEFRIDADHILAACEPTARIMKHLGRVLEVVTESIADPDSNNNVKIRARIVQDLTPHEELAKTVWNQFQERLSRFARWVAERIRRPSVLAIQNDEPQNNETMTEGGS